MYRMDACMHYFRGYSLLYTMGWILGHKSVLTTTIYTHLINFDADSLAS